LLNIGGARAVDAVLATPTEWQYGRPGSGPGGRGHRQDIQAPESIVRPYVVEQKETESAAMRQVERQLSDFQNAMDRLGYPGRRNLSQRQIERRGRLRRQVNLLT
jgi:hypothetical protein